MSLSSKRSGNAEILTIRFTACAWVTSIRLTPIADDTHYFDKGNGKALLGVIDPVRISLPPHSIHAIETELKRYYTTPSPASPKAWERE